MERSSWLLNRHKTESIRIDSTRFLPDCKCNSSEEHENTIDKCLCQCPKSTVKKEDILCKSFHLYCIHCKEKCIPNMRSMRRLKSNQLNSSYNLGHQHMRDIWKVCMLHKCDFLKWLMNENTWKKTEMKSC